MRRTRIALFAIAITLSCLGVVMIYSASAIYAYETLGDSSYYLKRHLIYLTMGFVLLIFAMAVPYDRLRRHAKPFLLASFFFLLLVLIPGIGKEIGGARRWFKIGSFSIQPSEIAKIAVIVYLADVLSRKQSKIESITHALFPAFAVLGMSILLVLVQPDLGTALALAAIGFIMCFASGVKVKHLSGLILASLPLIYALVFGVGYRRRRMLAFLNPWADPQGVGFQIIQSFLALGNGGLFGVGLGQSRQKLFYLPQSHTDFIFSIIGEELGFIGCGIVVLLFAAFTILAVRIAFKAREPFGRFLAVGVLSMIALSSLINIGVCVGALPTKGLPLPFISYGGTALLANLFGVGLLLNIAKNRDAIAVSQ